MPEFLLQQQKNSEISEIRAKKNKEVLIMHNKLSTATLITLCIVFLPLTTLAQTDGIPLQKDVYLEYPITTTEDLPDQITFNFYDSEDALAPIQTFLKYLSEVNI